MIDHGKDSPQFSGVVGRAYSILASNHDCLGRIKAFEFERESLKYQSQTYLAQVDSLKTGQVYGATIGLRNHCDELHTLAISDSNDSVNSLFDQTTRFKGLAFRTLANRARKSKDTLLLKSGEIRKALSEHLKEDEVLIEIFQGRRDYFAFVVLKKSGGLQIRHLRLESIRHVNACVNGMINELSARQPSPAAPSASRPTRGVESFELEKAGDDGYSAKLKATVWTALVTHFEGRKKIIVCGDGKLNLFPWAVLPGEVKGSFLIQEYQFGTETDLPAVTQMLARPALEGKSLVAFAGIHYSKSNRIQPSSKSTVQRTGGRLLFSELPGAIKEYDRIEKVISKQLKVQRFGGLQVDEDFVKAQLKPGMIMHFATHGAFQGNVDRASDPANRYRTEFLGADPLSQSLLALSLVNDRAQTDATGHDGILTGSEVIQWDLSEIPLVTLSSCDGALGEVRANDAVYGIQKAFRSAGARATVVSLWTVYDQQAPVFFEYFYRNLLAGKSNCEALRLAQMQLIEDGVPPKYWAGWIISGDWR